MNNGKRWFVTGGFFFLLATLNFTSHHTLTGVGFAVAALATLAAGWKQHRAKATPTQRSEPDPD